ncbi:hypothetical protein PILCRDRAFT_1568 [Piloderma croceum F 1598]|uniref:Uncharacterized protein n=1 Tax=Piloderma croceum (strain F 1598) TaxID=765440 RepID=A0A0C3GHV4_PILCF|nr:hypothetical protein PILCRDRAFT_1568 [Piloderma croceum F 1598]
MSSLQECIFDISDGSSSSFNDMNHPDLVYPPLLTTVQMISIDVNGNKTRGHATESHPLWTIPDLHNRIVWIPFITKLEIVHSNNITALDLLDNLKESSIPREFSVVSQLGGTAIKEIEVWHNMDILGIGPKLQVLSFHPEERLERMQHIS